MAGQATFVTERMVTRDVSRMSAGKRLENLSALNPAHLKALVGQEVVITLFDNSTRTGTVQNVDPVNFSVALLKAVVVEGGQKLALEALRGGHGHMFAGNVMIPVNHLNPYGATVPRPERTMSLEFLRSYSNPPGTSNGQGGGHGHGIGASDAHSSGKADAGYGLYGGGAGYGGNAVPLQRGFVNETGGGGLGFEMAAERRARVRCALEAARVPVQEVQETASPAPALMVMGCLRLPFPYTADACECPNEIVLSKVRQLIDTVR